MKDLLTGATLESLKAVANKYAASCSENLQKLPPNKDHDRSDIVPKVRKLVDEMILILQEKPSDQAPRLLAQFYIQKTNEENMSHPILAIALECMAKALDMQEHVRRAYLQAKAQSDRNPSAIGLG